MKLTVHSMSGDSPSSSAASCAVSAVARFCCFTNADGGSEKQ
jgi:hypothetical protein